MKNPLNQKQHIIPIVYLKQFSFFSKDKKQKINILENENFKMKEKSISRFNTVNNLYDIESDNPQIERIFEEYHGVYETEYPKIIKELDTKKVLSDKFYSLLIEFTADIICRSNNLREYVLFVLNSDAKSNFIKTIIANKFKTLEELNNSIVFQTLIKLSAENLINRILMMFNEYLWLKLNNFQVTFFELPEDKYWITTNNPVLLENNVGEIDFLLPESDIYFPLTLKYLAYFHNPTSKNEINLLRKFNENTINDFPLNLYEDLTKRLIRNATDFVIYPPNLVIKCN